MNIESRSPRIAQARVRLATDTLPQIPHRAGALCTEYALLRWYLVSGLVRRVYVVDICGVANWNLWLTQI